MIVRCKSCGSNIRYDIALGRLMCEYCGNSFLPEEFEDEETFDAVSYTCQSCGAELITLEDTEATAFCSFCGSASILTGRLNGIKKPDRILPFKITREKCREIYLKKAQQTFLAPRWMREEKYVESFRAIYMPYWSYTVHAKGTIHRSDESIESRDGEYIVTTKKIFEDTPVDMDIAGWSHDAANGFADDISETLGFTETAESLFKPFHSGYLSGFYADMAEKTGNKHKYLAIEGAEARLNAELGCTFKGNMKITEHTLSYMPVWFMSVRKGNNLSYAAVNGYSGKIIADFPVSSRGFFLIAGVAAALIAAFLSFAVVLRPEPAYWISFVLTVAGLFACAREGNRLRDITEAIGVPINYKETTYPIGCLAKLVLTVAVIALNTFFVLARMGILELFMFIMTCLFFTNISKIENIEVTKYRPYRTFVSFLLSLATALLLLTKNNLLIYGAALLLAVILSFNVLGAFRIHQEIARRRPPQMNRKGAEKDA